MRFKKIINKQLGELLIERGVITEEQFQKAMGVQKERGGFLIGEILIELGFLKEEDIAQTLTAQYGFPFLPLSNYEIGSEVIDIIPARIARQSMLVPIDKIGNNLTIAMSNPLDVHTIEDIEILTSCNVQVFVSTSSDIKRAIEKYYKDKK